MQSAYALRICIADTDRGSVRMEMYTKVVDNNNVFVFIEKKINNLKYYMYLVKPDNVFINNFHAVIP